MTARLLVVGHDLALNLKLLLQVRELTLHIGQFRPVLLK